MLYSFRPSHGRLKDVIYYFPLITDDSRTNERPTQLQPMPGMAGSWDPSGTAPTPASQGSFTVTFKFTPDWYVNNRNNRFYYNHTNSDITARENALLHFDVAVAEGGEGLLTDGYAEYGSTGIVDPVTGAAITHYQIQAKLTDTSTIVRTQGVATFEGTFTIQSATWKAPDGTEYTFF